MFADVTCLDEHRVVLHDGVGGDYIHASYVSPEADDRHPCIICTQGPTEDTTEDFYRMIRQEKCTAVFMLCRTTEESKVRLAIGIR